MNSVELEFFWDQDAEFRRKRVDEAEAEIDPMAEMTGLLEGVVQVIIIRQADAVIAIFIHFPHLGGLP